tara:strand:- start:6338 stop:6670 length:333 start_codon:yes stop_codon:yes gene_type:complete
MNISASNDEAIINLAQKKLQWSEETLKYDYIQEWISRKAADRWRQRWQQRKFGISNYEYTDFFKPKFFPQLSESIPEDRDQKSLPSPSPDPQPEDFSKSSKIENLFWITT